MKFFDVGQHATGFIAVGQHATGFFALGQGATGVVAVGQLARGVVAIGQLAFGLVGWGQLGAGVFHAVGMLGVGGRGFGPVLRLIPSVGRPRVLPPATSFAAVEAGQPGWIQVDLHAVHDGGSADSAPKPPGLVLYQEGARLPIKLDRRLQQKGLTIAAEGPRSVHAYVTPVGGQAGGHPQLVCDRIAYAPPRPYQKKGFFILAVFQLVGLLGLGTAYAALVGQDLLDVLDKIFMDETPPPRPAPTVRPPKGKTR
jgi:hypothetical protein